MSVKINQVSVLTAVSERYETLARLGSTTTYYDPNVRAFSSKTKAEEYILELKSCYDKLQAASGTKLQHMKFEIREVEVD